MKPIRALLLLIGSLVLGIAAWTSDVYALSMTVKSSTSSTIHNISFTSIAAGSAGCLTGFECYRISNPNWTGGAGGSLTFGSGASQIRLTTSASFTSGPIASIKDSSGAAGLAFNGGIFQGFSATTGQLTITFQDFFSNLTSTNPQFTLTESGAFLQPGGNVSGDNLTMLGTVTDDFDNNPNTAQTTQNIAQITKNATSGATSPYSVNLSPTVAVPNPSAGVTVKYLWTYNYNNTGVAGPITAANGAKFSDPEDCDEGEACNTLGGGGALLFDPNTPDGAAAFAAFQNQFCSQECEQVASSSVPEPSSVLLLGVALLTVGLFFAPRLRKKENAVD